MKKWIFFYSWSDKWYKSSVWSKINDDRRLNYDISIMYRSRLSMIHNRSSKVIFLDRIELSLLSCAILFQKQGNSFLVSNSFQDKFGNRLFNVYFRLLLITFICFLSLHLIHVCWIFCHNLFWNSKKLKLFVKIATHDYFDISTEIKSDVIGS